METSRKLLQFQEFLHLFFFAKNFRTAPEVPHRFARYHPAMESWANLRMSWSCMCIYSEPPNPPTNSAQKERIIDNVRPLTPLSHGWPKVDLNDGVFNYIGNI